MKVGEILGKNGFAKDASEAFLGLEFENESPIAMEINDDKHWKYVPENSLRGFGFESVLKKPLEKHDAFEAVRGLFSKQRLYFIGSGTIGAKETKLPFSNSIRTSVHVHFDATKLTFLQLFNFVCVYWMLEPLLQYYCGKHRQGNLFCLRLRDSLILKHALTKELKQGSVLNSSIYEDSYRYSSVNFNSISKFGSIEFRMMRGVNHEDDAITWVEMLDAIRRYAIKFENPLQLRDAYLQEHDAKTFAKDVLGKELWSNLSSYLPPDLAKNPTKVIREAFLSVVPILSARPDWEFVKNPIKKKAFTGFHQSSSSSLDLASVSHSMMESQIPITDEGELTYPISDIADQYDSDFVAGIFYQQPQGDY